MNDDELKVLDTIRDDRSFGLKETYVTESFYPDAVDSLIAKGIVREIGRFNMETCRALELVVKK